MQHELHFPFVWQDHRGFSVIPLRMPPLTLNLDQEPSWIQKNELLLEQALEGRINL